VLRSASTGLAVSLALFCFVGCGDEEGDDLSPFFVEIQGLALVGVTASSLAWGDFDNDGDLDLAVAGRDASLVATTKVYENDGAGGLSEISGLTLGGVWDCSLAWGDADNDGDLELAVSGMSDSGRITTVYKNVGGAVPFNGTELAVGLTGVSSCALAWGDADNDGDLDLAVAGMSDTVRTTRVYENVGGAVPFGGTEIAAALTGVDSCALAWGDCDSDGDIDLAVAGFAGSTQTTIVYENRDGQFDGAWELAASLTGVDGGSVAFGDADNDGDLDLAVAGYFGGGSITTVYENRNGVFNGTWELATGLTGVMFGSLAWGDVDNDGGLDLAVGGGVATTVYANDGSGRLAVFSKGSLMGASSCSLAWGDVDNDGDLDLAIAGDTGSGYIATVYETIGPLPNLPPEQVTDLTAFVAGSDVVLVWAEGSDVETPAGGLSYNLRVVDTGSGLDVFPAMAAADGRRRIPAIGPIRPGPSYAWHLLTLPSGDYEFQVQAIDSGLEGGPWSDPKPFTVP